MNLNPLTIQPALQRRSHAALVTGRRLALTLSLVLAILLAAVPQPAAASASSGTALPELNDFAKAVRNGDAAAMRGVYVQNLFALPVVQQPADQAGFVSTQDGTLTQFATAARFDTLGFLAHNYLSGKYFDKLAAGQQIVLVYGDGHLKYFKVTSVRRYQAIKPSSPYSDFKDLDSGKTSTAANLFGEVYKQAGAVVFQTCIESDGNSSWGRLFVIAQPVPAPASPGSGH
jgi:hypothetical protein